MPGHASKTWPNNPRKRRSKLRAIPIHSRVLPKDKSKEGCYFPAQPTQYF